MASFLSQCLCHTDTQSAAHSAKRSFSKATCSLQIVRKRCLELRDLVGGDYAKVGSYLSTWTGVTALAEFVLNPTIGRLSDTYGRKPFMMLSPYAAIVLKAWVLSVCPGLPRPAAL